MNNINKAFEQVIGLEGGYVHDPDDPGGETKFGISKQSYPDLDIANLTIEQAKAIYQRDYWDKAHCDKVVLHGGIALGIAYFDCAVNCGINAAVKQLQRALNGVMDKDRYLVVDGIIGPKTLEAIASYAHGLLDTFLLQRVKFYVDIANRKKSQRKFLRGWLNRVLAGGVS